MTDEMMGDDMTVFDPGNGRKRYRVGPGLEVEDLDACTHAEIDPETWRCRACGRRAARKDEHKQ